MNAPNSKEEAHMARWMKSGMEIAGFGIMMLTLTWHVECAAGGRPSGPEAAAEKTWRLPLACGSAADAVPLIVEHEIINLPSASVLAEFRRQRVGRKKAPNVVAMLADPVFDAFYTTKNNGMGIGLAVSRSIIEKHRGRLMATLNDGPGATFSFSIPRGI
jgi:hypothetical protein